MKADIDSPFSPGRIVHADLFVGRNFELRKLDERLRKTSRGATEVAFITGPRGIGKSSFAAKGRQVANERHKIVSLHVFLGGVRTIEELVKTVLSKLLNESKKFPWFERAKSMFGKSIKGVDLFGLKLDFDPTPTELSSLTNNFGQAISNFLASVESDVGGLLIVLDDINGLADNPNFANWVKATVDEMRVQGSGQRVFFLLSGLTGRRDALLRNQPSLDRMLDIIEIKPWSEEETELFYFVTFQSAGVEIDKEACSFMARMSGGFPVIAHEIGDATFYAWRNGKSASVTHKVAISGAYVAMREIGRKYLDKQFLGAIKSERYLNVLEAITKMQSYQFSRKELCSQLPASESSTVDNFLQKMKKLGFFQEGSERGSYLWVNPMHLAYLSFTKFRREVPDYAQELEGLQQLEADGEG